METRFISFAEVSKTFKLEGGKLFRLLKRGGKWREVNTKSSRDRGYCQVSWNGSSFQLHRILYSLYHEGDVDPSLDIDHLDGVKDNNCIENLRLGTTRENCQNLSIHRNGRLVGCCWDKYSKHWVAMITIGCKRIHLGQFDTEEEAHEVYLKACELIDQFVDSEQFRNLVNN